jgi:hypothetical protein
MGSLRSLVCNPLAKRNRPKPWNRLYAKFLRKYLKRAWGQTRFRVTATDTPIASVRVSEKDAETSVESRQLESLLNHSFKSFRETQNIQVRLHISVLTKQAYYIREKPKWDR